MKTLKALTITLILTMTFFTSCTDNAEILIDDSAQIQEIVDTFLIGSWRITNFNDSGQDETSDFAGFNFTFSANGSVVATNGTETINGTWSVTGSSSSNDDSNDDIDFNLFFSVSPNHNFEDLNDDWDVQSVTPTAVSLIDISGGNGGTDRLTFTRN